MKKLYILWVLAFIGIVIIGIVLAGGDIRWFISVASFVIVVLPGLLLSLANFSPTEIFHFFGMGFGSKELTEADLKKGLAFFRALQYYLILSGIIGTLIGLVAMLGTIEDPSKIGVAMSVALLTILYAFILTAAVTVPFHTGLRRKIAEIENRP